MSVLAGIDPARMVVIEGPSLSRSVVEREYVLNKPANVKRCPSHNRNSAPQGLRKSIRVRTGSEKRAEAHRDKRRRASL